MLQTSSRECYIVRMHPEVLGNLPSFHTQSYTSSDNFDLPKLKNSPLKSRDSSALIIKVPLVNSEEIPFSAHASETSFKLYLFDVGLRGSMSHLPPQAILDYDYG